MPRCFGDGDALYARYHDEEWGRPVVGERELFERLSLEGFQAGLSWLTILRKREAFRAAFAFFDPERVAAFGDDDVARLTADDGIVRHRGKIEAVIANAAIVLELRERGRPLESLVWAHAPARSRAAPRSAGDVPVETAGSRALSRELRALGWRFLGPTTAYAAMQACGLVNDHLVGCEVRAQVEAKRGRARIGLSESGSGNSTIYG